MPERSAQDLLELAARRGIAVAVAVAHHDPSDAAMAEWDAHQRSKSHLGRKLFGNEVIEGLIDPPRGDERYYRDDSE
jgi:hypothetical protein